MIELEHVTKHFGATRAVHNFSLQAAEGELIALLGESGCGKTTCLRMINRLIEPDSGAIRVNGESVLDRNPVELRRGIGYVIQGVGLFPHYTIAGNVAAVPQLLGWPKPEIDARVEKLLDLVNLPAAHFAQRMPNELSGGQRQRVGVARALAAKSKVMLMDEPFGALDPITRAELQDEFRAIQKKLELTVVMVTHDISEALLMADRIAVMHRGELRQIGTPHELMTEPADERVAALMDMPKSRADRVEALMEDAADG
jgi:osmoprotectant transport system ATP-binding protein